MNKLKSSGMQKFIIVQYYCNQTAPWLLECSFMNIWGLHSHNLCFPLLFVEFQFGYQLNHLMYTMVDHLLLYFIIECHQMILVHSLYFLLLYLVYQHQMCLILPSLAHHMQVVVMLQFYYSRSSSQICLSYLFPDTYFFSIVITFSKLYYFLQKF